MFNLNESTLSLAGKVICVVECLRWMSGKITLNSNSCAPVDLLG